MELEKKYQEIFYNMEEMMSSRVNAGIYVALGYTSNLDILCDFKIDILNGLLQDYLSDADLREMKVAKEITKIEEFLETIVFFCSNGIGGEVNIADFSIIKDTFQTKNGMGGTGTQGAMALATINCPSIVHLTDDSKEVCDILDSPYIYTVSKEGKLLHTNEVVQSAEQEIHYIIQFKKGDVIRLGGQKVTIPVSNRLIITKVTVNETVPFSEPYFKYIEENAYKIRSNVLSSFNAIQSKEILYERLEYVKKHIEKYKENNKNGIVYFEDAHYHSQEIRTMCLETIYPYVDIVSLNEEELEYTLNMYNFPVEIDDVLSCVRGIEYMKERFNIKKGIVVHTKDYSMYVGEKLESDIGKGLIFGNLLATAKAMYGWYGNKEQIEQVMNLPLSPKGVYNREIIKKEKIDKEVILVPTRYIDKPKYTIGLGDTFVAGIQMCF